ncbi:MAG: helix-turn-helix domain-containing protein [bacterium]|nr:helix-turn-helix domain-containing protein [bacterium]MCM1374816.1 helix-turn-helix domain-containing protein [Muribaculum sp.]
MNRLNLPDNLIRLRHEKGLTQEELAHFLGITKASVSKWEKGINTPDILLLPQLAAYFDVTVDELIGYEPQLSSENIRCQYAELSKAFATLPFAEALGKVRALAHKYYACYPLLLQLGILYLNHYMLAQTQEERGFILQEAVGWCDRIMDNCNDVGVCSDALVLKAGLQLQLGKAAEAVEALESTADPRRLAGGTLLIQAYQMAGDGEKARSYAQVKQYLDLLNLAGDATLALSLNITDLERCEEIMRRVTGMMELYRMETLHPNVAAQFQFQCAVVYAANGREEEALAALRRFERCVSKLMKAEQLELHGDDYFDELDIWIDRLPLGSMAPRDKSFIRQSLREALAHPAFDRMREREEFQRLVRSDFMGGEENA